MAIRERIDSLELKGRGAVYESVEEVEFAKAIKHYLDRDFELGRRTSSAQFPLVNLLVEESAKLVVDLEDMPHHVIGDSAEIILF